MASISETSSLLPVGLSTSSQLVDGVRTVTWKYPWVYAVAVTIIVLIPTLIGGILFLVDLTDRLYPSTPYAMHLTAALTGACFHTLSRTPSRLATSFFSVLDIYLCGFVYASITKIFETSFVDIDGSIVPEWMEYQRKLWLIKLGMSLVVAFRIFLGTVSLIYTIYNVESLHLIHPIIRWTRVLDRLDQMQGWTHSILLKKLPHLKRRLGKLFLVCSFLSLAPLGLCFLSCRRYLWWQPQDIGVPRGCCDDLDATECALPYPSFHHMRRDPSSRTGWRVNVQGSLLPPMKSDQDEMDFSFLHDLDGFSPMGGPILFYVNGLRETKEAESHGMKSKVFPTLPYNFQDSITERSSTMLWNVEDKELIPHTARVDYLDAEHPIILLIPYKPLNHASHYAVALVNASDVNGEVLSPTPGMQKLFSRPDSPSCSSDSQRLDRYQQILLPSLTEAAPWLIFPNISAPFPSLQLMFDFVTMSDESLYPIRSMRDATLQEIGEMDHQVTITKIQNQNCHRGETLVARTIHGSLAVPWWLENERRDAILSKRALKNQRSNGFVGAKFTIHVPCSLYAAAVNDTTRVQRPMRAILEYGHGLFYNRNEASEYSLLRVAEDQGYLIMAMDWRGMSSFDVPVMMKSLLADPNLIQATRDNIMQGYICRLTLQHFARNGLLAQNWLAFSDDGTSYVIPTHGSEHPTSVFYGSSQGGILGAAYTALLGPTGFIERGILGTPAVALSLVMYQSNSFRLYDALLMQNFYNNRHIRIVLSVLQLAWDPVTPSNFLAPPIAEVFPPMLLQSGLGDPVIPTIATEALARAYNASVLPHSPRGSIFGITKAPLSNTSVPSPHVTWTELLYESEYQMTPLDNHNTKPNRANLIHECLRQDCAFIHQMSEFIRTGQALDPCMHDGCLRSNISCYLQGRIKNKSKNWTCAYDSSM